MIGSSFFAMKVEQLTSEERCRFGRWLLQEAQTCNRLAKDARKLPGGEATAPLLERRAASLDSVGHWLLAED